MQLLKTLYKTMTISRSKIITAKLLINQTYQHVVAFKCKILALVVKDRVYNEVEIATIIMIMHA